MRRLGVLLGTALVAGALATASGAQALSVHGDASDPYAEVSFGTSCSPARISVHGYGEKMVLTSHSACGEKRGWHQRGRLRGVHSSLYWAERGKIVLEMLSLPSNSQYVYRVDAQLGGRRIERYLRFGDITRPDELVYEGTDAFVNFCINGTQRIESLNHRLFCVRPGESHRYVYVFRHDPR